MAMLIFDARHIAHEFTGLGRYTSSLLVALLTNEGRPNQIEILLDANADNCRIVSLERIRGLTRPNDLISLIDAPVFSLKHHTKVGRHVNARRGSSYFYPHFDVPLSVRLPTTFVIHDLLPLVVKDYLYRQRLLRRLGFRAIVTCSLLRPKTDCITVSESTKHDILHQISPRLESKVRVVKNASFLDPNAVEDTPLRELKLPNRFALYVGDRRPNKNLLKMVDIFRLLKRHYGYPGHFVIVGNRRNTSFDLDRYIAGDESIVTLGQVPDTHLIALYRKMDFLFFLSTYEGFGLPVLEAAAFNKKIITSSTSSLPEAAPPTALLLDPHLPAAALALRSAQYLSDKSTIDNAEHCDRFSWQRAAQQIFRLPDTNGQTERAA